MLDNLFTLFQSLLSPRWAMFCVQVPISQTRPLDSDFEGYMLGNMEAMLSHVKMLPFLDLISAYLCSCGAKYPDIQVPISWTRPLDSDF